MGRFEIDEDGDWIDTTYPICAPFAGEEQQYRVVDEQVVRDHLTTLESSHAELLEALKYIQEMLAFYEGSEQKLEGADTLVAVINAQGSDGDFQMMLSEARQAIARATEEK